MLYAVPTATQIVDLPPCDQAFENVARAATLAMLEVLDADLDTDPFDEQYLEDEAA